LEKHLKNVLSIATPSASDSPKLASSLTAMNTDTLADRVLSLYRFCKSGATGSVKLSLYTNKDGAEGFNLSLHPSKKKDLPTLRRSYAEAAASQFQGEAQNVQPPSLSSFADTLRSVDAKGSADAMRSVHAKRSACAKSSKDARRYAYAKRRADAARSVDAARPVDTVKPVDAAKPVDATRPLDVARSVDAVKPVDAARPGDAASPVDAARPGDAARPVYAARPVDATRPVDAAETGDAENHLPPSPTPIPQLDGVAEPDPVQDQDPEPVLQLRRRRYGFGKKGYRQWGQNDIDHPTLCVKCGIQVYIDKDRGNIFACKCMDNHYIDPLMLRSK